MGTTTLLGVGRMRRRKGADGFYLVSVWRFFLLLVLSPLLLTLRMQLTDCLSHSKAKSHRVAVTLCTAPEVITHLGAPEICDTTETLVPECLLPHRLRLKENSRHQALAVSYTHNLVLCRENRYSYEEK